MTYNQQETKFLRRLGAKIRGLREEQGWSQEELAFQSGLHRTYIGGIERGERNLAVLNARKIAESLDVPVQEIFPLEESGEE